MNENITAANDNKPRHAESFLSLADRRAWIAKIQMPKNDSDIRLVLGCPTLARLCKAGDVSRAKALNWWANAMTPLRMPTAMDAANDNIPTEDGWEKASWVATDDQGEKLDMDNLIEIRPTVFEMMAAVGRVSVSTKRGADGQWGKTEKRPHQLVVGKHKGKSRLAVGEDEIVGWYDRNGIERRAGVTLAGPKGGARKSRSTADIARYLDRPGSPFPPQWLAFDGGRRSERSLQAVEAQAVLDGAVANTPEMPAVAKLPTVVAAGANWLGGAVAKTGGSGGSLDAAALELELARTGVARRIRSRLGDQDASVLDMATTRMTAAEIGAAFGRSGSYARRWAVKAIDDALDKLSA